MLRVCRVAMVALMSAMLVLTGAPAVASQAQGPRVLVFTKVSDSKRAHLSTSTSAGLIEMSGRRYGFDTTVTDNAAYFTADRLATFDVVLWLNNFGDVLNTTQQSALSDWISHGGGFVGVHGAARAEPRWEHFTDLVGARPITTESDPVSTRTIHIDSKHPANNGLPSEITDHEDQWLEFDRDPTDEPGMKVLATAEEPGEKQKQPVIWGRDIDEGRAWYSALGHRSKPFEDGDFMKVLRGGIWWTADIDSTPKVDSADAAPAWPYGLSFLAWIGAVAVGGGIAVYRLNRNDDLT